MPATEPAIDPPPVSLVAWIDAVLTAHPRLRAQAARLRAAEARARGAARPVYNPEIELEHERTDVDETTAQLLQPFDIHGKRRARARAAGAELLAARARSEALRAELAGELLAGLAEHDAARAALALAEEVVEVLERFSDLARERARAGDIGQLEVDVAALAHLEAVIAATRDRTTLGEAGGALQRLAGQAPPAPGLPLSPPRGLPSPGPVETLLAAHPAVRAAQAEAQAAGAIIARADADRKADPTFGIQAGREGGEALVGLRLAFPLQIRNDFRDEVEAARAGSLEATEARIDIVRQVRGELAGALARHRPLAAAWELWQAEGAARLSGQLELLERLWRAGELSTAGYLVQIQQVLATRRSAVELRGELWEAWVAWLRAAGQVQRWLTAGPVAARAAGKETNR